MKSKKMSKIFISLLSATMALTLVPASAALAAAPESDTAVFSSVPADTWEISSEKPEIFLRRSVKAAFSEACERYQNGSMEVLAMYGEGVVSGVNYKMICRHTAADGTVSLKNVTMYDPNLINSTQRTAKARFTSVENFDIEDYTTDYKYWLPDEPKIGGMSLATSGEVDLPEEVGAVLDAVAEESSINYKPLAYLGKKASADGTDYAVLCYTYDNNDENHDEFVDVVILHSDNTVKSSHSIFGRRTVFPNEFKNLCTVEKNTIVVGDYVKVNFAAKGGSGNYKYKVSYRKKNTEKWYTKEFDSSTEYFKFKPAVATTYELTVGVDDGEREEEIYTFLWVNPQIQNLSTLSKETAAVGETIEVYAHSEGGQGQAQYAVYYRRKNTETWHAVQKYSYLFRIKLKAKTADDYEILVKAKDERGVVSKKYFTVPVR